RVIMKKWKKELIEVDQIKKIITQLK
ncbi:MAG: hypothetical protein RLZ10_3042, partial [Bacteroidota bacterium]